MKKFKTSLFLFHRDLRLEDNTGLIQALKESEQVIPVFILEKKQIENNPYRGDHALQFMLESLEELNQELLKKGSQLYLFYGSTQEILEKIIKEQSINAFYSNKDYTPFALKRDQNIKALCTQLKIEFFFTDDALINIPGSVLKDNGTPYVVFTPFKRTAQKLPVQSPQKNCHTNYYSETIQDCDLGLLSTILEKRNNDLYVHGGRKNALKIYQDFSRLKNYQVIRDIPSNEKGTSHLSAHLKFGTVSARETWQVTASHFGPDHTLISELYWRDFFYHIAVHFPWVFKGAFHEKYNSLKWNESSSDFQKWCEGKTGYPIVDAGMRQLNETGYMHNRVRMITASFLVKDLHINWQWGERYFAQKLVDYDPCINNGNWQWAASTGCDAQPYFRIFNPWRQQERFDPDAKYIKKWIPELTFLSSKEIHHLKKQDLFHPINYPKVIVDHKEAAKKAKEMYKSVNL